MKQISTLYLVALMLLIACSSDRKYTAMEVFDLKPFPVVLDSSGASKYEHFFFDENSTTQSISDYNFYYIGKVKDTIFLNPYLNFYSPERFGESENPYAKYYKDWLAENNFKSWIKTRVAIQLDTATKLFNSFPVMLTNFMLDTIVIGYGRVLPLEMEAIDSLGNWVLIQKRFIYSCGNGVGTIVLPPKECVITLAPIFNGNYKTKLRMRLGDNLSHEFTGFINYSQFQAKQEDRF